MDISQESDPKSQDEIPSESAIWTKFLWLADIEREREVQQLKMFASYRSLELAWLFSIYTNKQFKALKSLDTYSQMVSGFVASVQGKEIEGKIGAAKVRNSQRMNDPLLDH